jgi:hypothetical protein
VNMCDVCLSGSSKRRYAIASSKWLCCDTCYGSALDAAYKESGEGGDTINVVCAVLRAFEKRRGYSINRGAKHTSPRQRRR